MELKFKAKIMDEAAIDRTLVRIAHEILEKNDGTGFEREQGYLYPHNYPHAWVRQQYLPDEIKDRRYYEYGDNKTEQAAKRYWDEIKK